MKSDAKPLLRLNLSSPTPTQCLRLDSSGYSRHRQALTSVGECGSVGLMVETGSIPLTLTQQDRAPDSQLLDDLLEDHAGGSGIEVIRRTDLLRFVDLTTLERTISLELNLPKVSPARETPQYIPLGLLGSGSNLGSFRIADRSGSRLVTPARAEAREVAEDLLVSLVDDLGLDPEDSSDTKEQIKALLKCGDKDLCDWCTRAYRTADEEKEEATSEEESLRIWRRHQLGCRALFLIVERLVPAGGNRNDTRDKLVRRLFDFAESLPLPAEWPEQISHDRSPGVTYVSCSFHEDVEPWYAPKVSRALKLTAGNSLRERARWWWISHKVAYCEKVKGRLANQGPIADAINVLGHWRGQMMTGTARRLSGFRSLCILWEQGTIADQRSYHVDIEVPEGLVIARATTLVPVIEPEDGIPAVDRNPATEVGHGAHIVVGRRTDPEKPKLRRRVKSMTVIEVAAADTALWLIGAAVALASAVLMAVIAARWSFIFAGHPSGMTRAGKTLTATNDRVEPIVSLLVIAPSLVAAFLAIRASNEIGAALLHGLQLRLAFVGGLTIACAVLIIVGKESDPTNKVLVWIMVGLATLTAISLLIGWFVARNNLKPELLEPSDRDASHPLLGFPPPSKFVRSAEGARWIPHGWPATEPTDDASADCRDEPLWAWTEKDREEYGDAYERCRELRGELEPILDERPAK